MEASLSRRAVILGAAAGLLGSAAVARAAPMSFTVALSGAQQVPPVATKGHGTAHLTYNPANRMLSWSVSYQDMSSPVTMAHFHGPAPAGKNAKVQIWISRKGAKVPDPIKGSAKLTPAQAKQFLAGMWYINVHTKDHPPGEIRGQVKPPMG
ncbi:MAG: CHRD domain-containing protein [Rhodospirillales bacterium]|nr:CHRD domain-containing protein [Rhodospirillales bacterium]